MISHQNKMNACEARKPLQKCEQRIAFLRPFVIIAGVSFAIYFNSLHNGFVYDDVSQVVTNPWITSAQYLRDIFSSNVGSFEGIKISNYYRPIMHVFYMINFHIFGLKPWGFHLVNLLIHTGVCIMVFLVTTQLLGRHAAQSSSQSVGMGRFAELHSPPFIAALLFATHPIHTEAVTWIAALPELLFTFFSLLSFYLYMRARALCDKDYLLSVAAFFIATLCKETALSLFLILIAYDHTFHKKERAFVERIKRYAPFILVSGIYLFLRFHALGGLAPSKSHGELSTYQVVINSIPLFGKYMEKLLLPINLNGFYVPISSIFEERGIISLAIIVILVAMTFVALRKNKIAFLGILFIVFPLLPVLYIPVLGENSFSDRYLYFPSFGFVMVLSLLLCDKKAPRKDLMSGILIVMAVFYSLGTVARNPVWKNDITLYQDMVEKSPDSYYPHMLLGHALLNGNRVEEGRQHLLNAWALNPNYVTDRLNEGIASRNQGNISKAIFIFLEVLMLKPDSIEAHYHLGLAYEAEGWLTQAIEEYSAVLKIQPNHADAQNQLGVAYAKQMLIDKAIEHFTVAVQLRADSQVFRDNLNNALAVQAHLKGR